MMQEKHERRRAHIGWKLALGTRAGRAHGFLLFWPFWERFTRSLWHIRSIPHAPHRLLEVRFTRHTGRPIDLPDGTHVDRGDPIVELHLRSQAFLEMGEQAPTWKQMQVLAQNMRALACWMQEPDFPSEPRAVFSVTLLYRGAAPRLGFTLRPRPKSIHTYLERFFMDGLLVLYNRQGSARLQQGNTYGTFPQEIWISRAELLRRYGSSRTLSPGRS